MKLRFLSSLALGLVALPAHAQETQDTAGLAPLGEKPDTTVVTEEHDGFMLEVKFVHGSGVVLEGDRFAGNSDLQGVNAYLDSMDGLRERMFQQSDEWLRAWRASGEARSGKKLHDLTLFYRVTFDRLGLVGPACDALNGFDVVQIAYPVGTLSDPVVAIVPGPAVGTPDFQGMQGYREAAPLGVDADYGNTFSGGQGTGITIADVETGWTDNHEDIAHKAQGNFIGLPNAPYPWDHGTAVLGELVGEDNAEGVLGICYDADILMSTHQGNSSNIPAAVANAANAVGPGDVVVLEVQCFGGFPAPFPCEAVQSIFTTCETATANGIHVFAAAGNGNNNLDSAVYNNLFNTAFRDSGAVMVGASDGSSLNKASFSNYGSRCNAHGWGFNVTTAGYGGLFGNNVTNEYTATFSGTSSATPIVTGAGVILNGIHRENYGTYMDPFDLRDLLTNTGTPQGSGGNIGPRPNVRAAIASLNWPRTAISANIQVGGNYDVSGIGVPGDTCVIVFGSDLNSTNPIHSPPYGYFFLQNNISRVMAGNLDGFGTMTYTGQVPNDNSLSGTTIGYYQSWQRFLTPQQQGTGGFGNWVPIEVQ